MTASTGLIVYPSALPAPMPGSLSPRQRRAASSIDGLLQQRARQRDAAGRTSQYTYTYTPEQMAEWLAWWRDDLLDGRRWFAHDLPGRGGLAQRVVRYREVRQELLGLGMYRVSAGLEQRGASRVAPVDGDPHWSSVILLLHGDGVEGSTTIADSSLRSRPASASGVFVSTTHSRFGGASLRANGAGSFLEYGTSADFGSDREWTVEFWVYVVAFPVKNSYYFCNNVSRYMSINANGTLFHSFGTPNNVQLEIGVWTHIAIARDAAGGIRTFKDGVMHGVVGGNAVGGGSSLPLGVFSMPTRHDLEPSPNIFLDEIRYTTACRYITNFTAPIAPFPEHE